MATQEKVHESTACAAAALFCKEQTVTCGKSWPDRLRPHIVDFCKTLYAVKDGERKRETWEFVPEACSI